MAEAVVYAQTVEALIRSLGDKLDAQVARELAEIGIDVYDDRRAACTLTQWTAALSIGARALTPEATQEEAMYQFGRRFVLRIGDTLVGRGLLQLARVLGPRRSLERLNKTFASVNSFSDSNLRLVRPGEFELSMSHVAEPQFVRGLYVAGLEISGAVDPRVEIVTVTGAAVVYQIRWSQESRPLPPSGVDL